MKIWVLTFLLSKSYYEVIYVSPNQSLSVSPPTLITLSVPYDSKEKCMEALKAVQKHFSANGRCMEADTNEQN